MVCYRTSLISLVTALVFAVGCGKSSSKDSTPVTTTMTTVQQKDTSQVFAAMSSTLSSVSSAGFMDWSDCPTTKNGCAVACAGGIMTITCDGTVTQNYSCDSTSYLLENSKATVVVDISGFSKDTATGTINYTMDFSASITGGGTTTASAFVCHAASTTTLANGAVTGKPTLSCADFSCTMGGSAITCADMQTALDTNKCSTTTGGAGAATTTGTPTTTTGTGTTTTTGADTTTTGTTSTSVGQCDMSTLVQSQTCIAYPVDMHANCTAGSWITTGCPTALGHCAFSTYTTYYYSASTLSIYESACSRGGGTWAS